MAHDDDTPDPCETTHDDVSADIDDPAFDALLREIAAPRPMDAPGPAPGDLLDDRFEIIAELGRGGMGRVYLARDLTFGRRVAVKLWRTLHARHRQALLDEARATARLSHPAIVTVFHSGTWRDQPFLVLEYLRGESLGDRLRRAAPPLALPEVLDIATRLAGALAHAHRQRVVHRDLKPDNVVLLDDGTLKVVDFGLAHVQYTDAPDAELAWRAAGTPGYMAPEQRHGLATQTPAVDTWAFGILVRELLAGTPAPPALESLLARCLSPDPADRPPDGTALLEALGPLQLPATASLDASPYRYLEAFDARDAPWFFGRGAETRRLRRLLRDRAIVAVVGPSGAGKSSLVRAGLLATLAAEPDALESITVRPGRAPLRRLWRAVDRLTGHDTAWPPPDLPLDHVPGRLAARLRAHHRARGGQLVVFVDQLEELFTLTDDAATRRRVLQTLLAIGDDPGSGLAVVLAMREEFLVRLGELAALRDEVVSGLLLLSPPDRHSMRESLCAPAALCGVTFEPALVDTVLDTLADEPTPLPLLQFTASRLWDGRAPDAHHLDGALLESLGGVGGLVVAHAEALVRQLPGADDLVVLRTVLRALCGDGGTRRRETLSRLTELGDPDTVRRVVDQFVAGRLLSTSRGEEPGEAWVEIAHEILIARWERLREWLEQDRGAWRLREALARTAAHWDSRERPDALLWDEGLLVELEPHVSLTDVERDFVDRARQRAHDRATAARQTRARVELAGSRELAAAASAALGSAPARALKLAREAVHVAASVEATSALYAALDATHERHVLTHDSRVAALAVSPDAHHLASISLESHVDLFDLASGTHLHRLEGHERRVTGVAFSPDGTRLLTCSIDATARLWSVAEGRAVATLRGHEGRVVGASWSSDGRTVLTWAFDGTVRLWSGHDGRQLVVLDDLADSGRISRARLLPGQDRVVACGQAAHACLWSSDGRLVARLPSQGERALDVRVGPGPHGGHALVISNAPVVGVWRGDEGSLVGRLEVGPARVSRACFDHGGRRVAIGLDDGRVALHALDDETTHWLEGHEDLVNRLCFSDDDVYLASAALDDTVRVWRSSGTMVRVCREHRARVTAMGFAPGRRPRLWTAGLDGHAFVHEVHADHVTRLVGHTASINDAAITADGRHLVTASDDATARVWSIDNEPLVWLRGHGDAVAALAFAPGDADTLLSGATDATARLWGLTAPPAERGRLRHLRRVRDVAWSPDGQHLASATDDGVVFVADRDGRTTARLTHDGASVVAVRWTDDGARLVTAAGNDVYIWSSDGQRLAHLQGHTHAIESLCLDPHGPLALTGSIDRTARLWDLSQLDAAPRMLEGHRGRLTCVGFVRAASDGAWCAATADSAGHVAVWRADVPGPRWSSHHELLVSWLALTPDAASLVVTSWDGTGRILRLDDGAPGRDALVLEGHDGPIVTGAMSPDGARVATGGEDGTVRLWAVSDGHLEAVVQAGHRVSALAWSDDGRRLAIGTMAGDIRVIVVGLDALVALADERLGLRTTA